MNYFHFVLRDLYEKLLEDVPGSEALTAGKAEIASVEKEIENYKNGIKTQ